MDWLWLVVDAENQNTARKDGVADLAASKRRVGVRYLSGAIDTRRSLDCHVIREGKTYILWRLEECILVSLREISLVSMKRPKVTIEVSEKITAGEERVTDLVAQSGRSESKS